ncbi:hypothetical protein BD626DRAFT_162464 [Schizophyllum amplum]|uniref:Uncharacterized protein n=1 Tax=Schizophyllum amplum TaxID=97359 RepID=A0A550CPH4_9AGAR|nr:hypothetical protein BD626DRAFT_162464 [Auriculariopsis ampla]
MREWVDDGQMRVCGGLSRATSMRRRSRCGGGLGARACIATDTGAPACSLCCAPGDGDRSLNLWSGPCRSPCTLTSPSARPNHRAPGRLVGLGSFARMFQMRRASATALALSTPAGLPSSRGARRFSTPPFGVLDDFWWLAHCFISGFCRGSRLPLAHSPSRR